MIKNIHIFSKNTEKLREEDGIITENIYTIMVDHNLNTTNDVVALSTFNICGQYETFNYPTVKQVALWRSMEVQRRTALARR